MSSRLCSSLTLVEDCKIRMRGGAGGGGAVRRWWESGAYLKIRLRMAYLRMVLGTTKGLKSEFGTRLTRNVFSRGT